ncbi:hypothetical protein BD413DRAFT_253454 [Trametes elegans]|nr:hypothetical protein BD413DRAFT_253454 [Trametes elegans]
MAFLQQLPILYKAPLLVAAVVAERFAFTAPTPPPQDDEKAKFGGGDFITRLVKFGQLFAVTFAWLISVVDIAAIVALQLRATSPPAAALLSVLFHDPSAADRLALSPSFLLGLALLTGGAALRKRCYVTLGRYFTFQLAVLKEHKLVTSGPYAVVRHPAYTGFAAAVAGMVLVQLSPGSWAVESAVLGTLLGKAVLVLWMLWNVSFVVGALRRVPMEDDVLRKEFGQQWDRWAEKTPYALVPYVY